MSTENDRSERCYICGGSGRRSSFVLAAHGEIEGECPDCEGTGRLSNLLRLTPVLPADPRDEPVWLCPGCKCPNADHEAFCYRCGALGEDEA